MIASVAELLGDSLTNGNSFMQTNLVSDGTVLAAHIDHHLINPWGMSEFSPTGPVWISDNNAGVTTFYNLAPHRQRSDRVQKFEPHGQSFSFSG